MKTLLIEDLHVEIDGKAILNGVDLTINENEVHALMGPNGNGKSTLVQAIMGHPKYTVTKGRVIYDGQDVLSLPVNQRSKLGLFLAMQYPQEISGITNSDFLRACLNERSEEPISFFKFYKTMQQNIEALEMKSDLAHRFLNVGFSGGEKKRNEIMQMKILKPSLAMLDEIDSGLDVDALKIVAKAIGEMIEDTKLSLLVVSHYERFYQLLKPTFAHVLINGKIVKTGGIELVNKIDDEGYDWLYKEIGIQPVKEKVEVSTPISLSTCGASQKGL